jgi:hypothetical protein
LRLADILFAAAMMLSAGAAAALELSAAGDVRWVSGGVSQEERLDMLLLLPDYNLRVLTAAEKSGAYLAEAQVVVRDATGRVVLETVLEGPFLLASLAPGTYELRATFNGKSHVRTITIPASGRREVFLYWVVPDLEVAPRERAE